MKKIAVFHNGSIAVLKKTLRGKCGIARRIIILKRQFCFDYLSHIRRISFLGERKLGYSRRRAFILNVDI